MTRFVALFLLVLAGCAPQMYVPDQAARPYSFELHSTKTVDMQVFRIGEVLQIVNATSTSYRDFDLWINQQYAQRIDSLPPGATIEVSLWEFFDQYGRRFNAGGFFRTFKPTPVRLVEIQTTADDSTVGLIAIRAESVDVPVQRQ